MINTPLLNVTGPEFKSKEKEKKRNMRSKQSIQNKLL